MATCAVADDQRRKNRPEESDWLAVDGKNKELWVSSLGNSSASAFPLSANGDVAPLRTIRSAPAARTSGEVRQAQAVAYDSKREEYLVPIE